jgi:hypothetical protein
MTARGRGAGKRPLDTRLDVHGLAVGCCGCEGEMRRELVGIAIVLLGSNAAAQAPALTICVDRPRSERASAEHLATWLPAVRLNVARRESCCRDGFRGWFEAQDATVRFVLADRGAVHRRSIPWLRRANRPLSALAARGKLAAFSVLLQALIAEHQLAWLLENAPAAGARETPAPEQPSRRDALEATLSALAGTVAPRPPRRARACSSARAADLQNLPRLGAVREERAVLTEPSSPKAPLALSAIQPQVLAAPTRPVPRASTPEPARSTSLDEPGLTAFRGAPVRAAPRPAPPTPVVERVSVERPLPTARKRAPVDARALFRDLSIEAQLAGRWRSGDLWSLEVGGALAWRSIVLRAGYQPAAEWQLEGRPIEVTVVPLAAGWRPRLWSRRSLALRAEGALLVEWTRLRRLDLERADYHAHWDVGLSVGAGLALARGERLRVALDAVGFWFPAARTIEISHGPSTRLTTLGARLALTIGWGRLR